MSKMVKGLWFVFVGVACPILADESTRPDDLKDCEDKSEECHQWAIDGLCEDTDEEMKASTLADCPWSCGLCVKASADLNTAPKPEQNERSTWTMSTAGLDRIVGPEANGAVMSAEVCRLLIEAGEKTGFKMAKDSIDSNPAMDISVYNHNRVKAPLVWEILEPFMPLFKAELDRRFKGQPDVENELDWVFFRKYKAGTVRSALLGHKDSNKHSINLALNTNFEGGGLYFIPPESEMGIIANGLGESSAEDSNKLMNGLQPDHVPGPEHGNQSNYFFPFITPGVAMVYDNTVWHGVTPVTEGIRYTLSFFYDEPVEIKYQDDPDLLAKATAKDGEGEAAAPEQPDSAEVSMKATFENTRSTPNDVGLYWIRNPESLLSSGWGKITVNRKKDVVFVGDGTEDTPEWKGPIMMDTYSSHWFGAVERETNVLVHAWMMTQKTGTYRVTDDHEFYKPAESSTSSKTAEPQDSYYDDDDPYAEEGTPKAPLHDDL